MADRNSPPPSEQSDAQTAASASGNIDAAPSAEHAKDASEDAKESVLSSNPEGPLETAAHDKVSKKGRGPGI